MFTVPQNLRWHFCVLRLQYQTFLAPEFGPNLIIVFLHCCTVHVQLSCDFGFIGHFKVRPQIGSDGFLLGADPVGILRAGPRAQGGDLRLHLEDQFLQFLLALLLCVSVDIPGVLFAVRPDGGVSSLPEVFFDLLEVAGSWPRRAGWTGVNSGPGRRPFLPFRPLPPLRLRSPGRCLSPPSGASRR